MSAVTGVRVYASLIDLKTNGAAMEMLRVATRSLRRSPVFTAVAVVSLAVSLGVASGVGAIVNAVLRPGTAFHQPERLFSLDLFGAGNSTDELLQKVSQVRPEIVAMAQFRRAGRVSLSVGGDIQLGAVARVDPSYFSLLGVKAAVGRLLDSDIDKPNDAVPSAVISNQLWRRSFGGRRIADLQLFVDGVSHRVVGVTPVEMRADEDAPSVWTLLDRAAPARPGMFESSGAVVRLANAQQFPQVRDGLRTLAKELSPPLARRPYHFVLSPLVREGDTLRAVHYALIAGALAIVLIACANLAALILARGLSREGETAVRLALGASRKAIVQSVLAECAVLVGSSSCLGIMLSSWSVDVVRRYLPANVAYFGSFEARLDWVLIALLIAGALGSAVAMCLWPALRIARTDIATPLKGSASGVVRRSQNSFRWFVALEVALSLAVVVSAGMLLRAANYAAHFDPRYPLRDLVEGWITPRVPVDSANPRERAALAAIARSASHLPGARSASVYASAGLQLVTATLPGGGSEQLFNPRSLLVDENYFATTGIPIVSGRSFEPGDGAEPVAIVDELAARTLWRGVSPIGQLIAAERPRSGTRWYRVVGVSRFVQSVLSIDEPGLSERPRVYLSTDSFPRWRQVVVRAEPGQLPLVSAGLDALVRDMGEGARLGWMQRGDFWIERVQRAQSFVAFTFVTIALIALSLSGIGLYAVLAFSVQTRRRELALRRALGAPQPTIVREVGREAALMVFGGTAVGAFAAMFASPLIDTLIFDQYRISALALVSGEVIVGVVACIACFAPTRRALRADPSEVLRAT